MGANYLSYIDKTTNTQILGCLLRQPSLLNNKDYKLNIDDFGDTFHKAIYAAIVNLYTQGAQNISIIDIDNYLSARPHLHKVFLQYKGVEFLQMAYQIANLENFDYYYNRLRKMSVLRAMTQLGIDVTNIYDPNCLDLETKTKQEEWLNSHSIEDIVKIIDKKLDNIKNEYVNDTASYSVQAGEGLDELINSLQRHPEIGVPLFGGGIINTITRGARLKKFYLRSAPSGLGKCVTGNTLINTDKGLLRIDEIPQFYNVDKQNRCEAKIIAYNIETGKKKILNTSHWYNMGEQDTIKITTSFGYEIEGTSEHPIVVINDEGKMEFKQLQYITKNDKVAISLNNNLFGQKKLDAEFAYYIGRTMNYQSEIPIIIRQCNKETLKTFLKGVFNNNNFFITKFKNVAQQIQILLLNFGIVSKLIQENDNYVLNIIYKFEDKNIFIDTIDNIQKGRQTVYDFTVPIEHNFVSNGIISHNTRLSVADAAYIACSKIYNIFSQEWEDTKFSEPTLFITTELELSEIQTMLLAFISGVNESDILNGEYTTQQDLDRVLEASKIIKNSPLWLEHIPDFSLEDIENIIIKHVRKNNVKYVFFDYIHTSLKILEEITTKANGVRLREDIVLLMMATRLKDICNEYGIFLMSATQLNSEWETKEVANQNLLRGSKAIADKIDLGMIMLPVMEDDIAKLRNILDNNGLVEPNLKISVYKNRRGEYKDIIIWCTANLGICRITPLFVTDNYYRIINIKETKVIVEPEVVEFK